MTAIHPIGRDAAASRRPAMIARGTDMRPAPRARMHIACPRGKPLEASR